MTGTMRKMERLATPAGEVGATVLNVLLHG
jgi:hypothetical protein